MHGQTGVPHSRQYENVGGHPSEKNVGCCWEPGWQSRNAAVYPTDKLGVLLRTLVADKAGLCWWPAVVWMKQGARGLWVWATSHIHTLYILYGGSNTQILTSCYSCLSSRSLGFSELPYQALRLIQPVQSQTHIPILLVLADIEKESPRFK